MAALTARRDTLSHGEGISQKIFNLPVTATKHIYPGALVVVNSSGTIEPATAAGSKIALGRAEIEADNTNSLSPAPTCRVASGVFSFLQTGTTITNAHIGKICYIADDQTVTLNSSGTSPVGAIQGLDDAGNVKVSVSPAIVFDTSDQVLATKSVSVELSFGTTNFTATPDTNGTAVVFNVGSALPAGAIIQGYLVHLKTSFLGNATLTLKIGTTSHATDIMSTSNLMGTAGYLQGTPGAVTAGLAPATSQVIATLTPDGSSKASAISAGDVVITVLYTDLT